MELLGSVCTACGVKRKYKSLRYDSETFLPYCEHSYICSERHPNSVRNIITRQTEVTLITYQEANNMYMSGMSMTHTERVRRLLSSPCTVRITNLEMAEFLIQECDKNNLSMSDLVRGYIQSAMGGQKPEEEEEPKPKKKIKLSTEELTF